MKERTGLSVMLRRALSRCCPHCGAEGIFKSYYTLVDACPRCGHHYVREDGYWVSAIIVNTAVTEAIFGLLFVGGIFAMIPNIRWMPLLVIGAVTNLIVPVLFFPYSKTVWVAIDLFFNPPSPGATSSGVW